MPEKIRRCEEQLGRLQRQLGSLRSLQPTWVLYKDAREALPGLTAREAELREREQNAADQVGRGEGEGGEFRRGRRHDVRGKPRSGKVAKRNSPCGLRRARLAAAKVTGKGK